MLCTQAAGATTLSLFTNYTVVRFSIAPCTQTLVTFVRWMLMSFVRRTMLVFARQTVLTFARQTVLTFVKQTTVSQPQPIHECHSLFTNATASTSL